MALPTLYRIHDVFYISLLELYRQRAGEEPADPMPLADEESEWEVEAIRGKRTHRKKLQYLVKWKDWPEEYTQWE